MTTRRLYMDYNAHAPMDPVVLGRMATEAQNSVGSKQPASTIERPDVDLERPLALQAGRRSRRLTPQNFVLPLNERHDEPVEFGDFVVEVKDSASEGFQGDSSRDHRFSIPHGIGPRSCAGTKPLHACEVADLVAHFLRCGDDRIVELLQGRAPAFHRRLSRCAKYAQGFHGAGTALGHLDPTSGSGSLCRRDRIEGIVLALGSSTGWVRPGHLEYGYPRRPVARNEEAADDLR